MIKKGSFFLILNYFIGDNFLTGKFKLAHQRQMANTIKQVYLSFKKQVNSTVI